jgi:hypothetical protein
MRMSKLVMDEMVTFDRRNCGYIWDGGSVCFALLWCTSASVETFPKLMTLPCRGPPTAILPTHCLKQVIFIHRRMGLGGAGRKYFHPS